MEHKNAFSLLSPELQAEISKLGFILPTAPQNASIPAIISGQNVLLISPTGSGKTEAALLPIIDKIIQQNKVSPVKGIFALYITPLRALNNDILVRMIDFAARIGVKIEVRHGDTTQYQRRKQALKPPDILITTPETLQAILPAPVMREHLKNVKYVIVDEIHELASSKRGAQLAVALERLEYLLGHSYQRIGLSATVQNPEVIGKFLVGKDREVKILEIKSEKKLKVLIETPYQKGKEDTALSRIKRIRRIIEHINKHNGILIFCNTRRTAETISKLMNELDKQLSILVHHSSLSKEVREEAEHLFKAGKLKAIVATSSLELGIDIGHVDYVIQYASPKEVHRLVQRIGRSEHKEKAVSQGSVITYPTLDDIFESLVIVYRASQGITEHIRPHIMPLDVMVHQIAGIIMDNKETDVYTIYNILSKAYPFFDMTPEEFKKVMDFMEQQWLFKREKTKIYTKRKTRMYYYSELSMIPDQQKYLVRDEVSHMRIGFLDEDFVASYANRGDIIVLQGNLWEVIDIDGDNREVKCVQVKSSESKVPHWEGETIPVPFEIAQDVGKLWYKGINENISNVFSSYINEQVSISDESVELAERILAMQKQSHVFPSDKNVVIEFYGNHALIHAPFGSRINNTLALYFSIQATLRMGFEIATDFDPYRIVLSSNKSLDPKIIERIFLETTTEELFSLIKTAVRNTRLFEFRFLHVAQRFGVIRKNSERTTADLKRAIRIFRNTVVEDEAINEILHDKLDLPGASKIFKQIQDGKIEITFVPKSISEASPLALYLLEKSNPDLATELSIENEMLELVERRLMEHEFKFVCIFKGDWEEILPVRLVEFPLKCPVCGSVFVSPTYISDKDLPRIARKRFRGEKLTRNESELYKRAWTASSLIQSYKQDALLALAGFGIGPTTAARILSRFHKNRKELIRDIIEAEKNYVKTKPFWD